jgi:serine/threonine protein kinase
VAGLAAIHQEGIVHRDLTPQNLLRMDDGRVVVADFGLAFEGGQSVSLLGGTPKYLPPEVERGEPATFAADVWQLGVVMHEILFGRRPAWEDGPTGRRVTWPLQAGASRAEQAMAGACIRCLSDRPSDRPAAAWDVWRDIVTSEQRVHEAWRWFRRPSAGATPPQT